MARSLRSLGTLAALALILVLVHAGGTSAASGPLYVSPNGSTTSACTKQSPCKGLQRAFRLAAPGQVVQLLPGAYPSMTLESAPKASSAHVVFRPATGAAVTFTGRLTVDGAAHVTLSGLSLARTGPSDRSLYIRSCTSDITLDHVSGETFFIMEGTRSITFRGGSWGGYSAPGEEDSAIGTSDATGPGNSCNGQLAAPAGPIVFDHVTFHDVFWNVPESGWGGSHPDCFEVNGYVNGLTIKNSRFLRCASTFMQINGDQGDMSNLTFENNTYSQLGNDTWYGIQITSEGKPGKCGSLIFRHNTYLPANADAHTWPNGPIRTDCEAVPGTNPVLITANLFARSPPSNECARYLASPYSTSWTGNLFASGSCGPGSRGIPFGYMLGPAGLKASADAAAVRLLFQLAAKKATHSSAAKELARRKLRAPSGRWSVATIDAIVRDTIYTGGMYGAPGSQPALVGRPTWRAAQQILTR